MYRLRNHTIPFMVAAIWIFLAGTDAANAANGTGSGLLTLDSSAVDLAIADSAELPASQPIAYAPSQDHPAWETDLESKMWPGFLTGLGGYQDFVMPVGFFIYFEDPFITTDARLIYVHHEIPDSSVLRGGQIDVVAMQLRIALSERWSFIAVKDGYSWIDTGATDGESGWNDITVGLKYALHSDPEKQFLVSTGLRWEWSNGSSDVFQGGAQELSPFVAMAKGWDKWHFLSTVSGRIPTNQNEGNASILWNMHLDYKLTETFRPLVEVTGIHWLSNGDGLDISQDLLDVSSIGVRKADGTDFFSGGIGFRWQARDNVNVGVIWEFPLENKSEHLMDQRVTLNTVISF